MFCIALTFYGSHRPTAATHFGIGWNRLAHINILTHIGDQYSLCFISSSAFLNPLNFSMWLQNLRSDWMLTANYSVFPSRRDMCVTKSADDLWFWNPNAYSSLPLLRSVIDLINVIFKLLNILTIVNCLDKAVCHQHTFITCITLDTYIHYMLYVFFWMIIDLLILFRYNHNGRYNNNRLVVGSQASLGGTVPHSSYSPTCTFCPSCSLFV